MDLGLGIGFWSVAEGESRKVHAFAATCVAKEIAKDIGTKGPLAIRKAMDSINAVFGQLEAGYAVELKNFGELVDSADAKEGTQAFLDKRQAEFKGN